MNEEQIRQRIEQLQRQVNDLLASLIQPLQQLSAWQAQIALLNDMLPKEQPKKEGDK